MTGRQATIARASIIRGTVACILSGALALADAQRPHPAHAQAVPGGDDSSLAALRSGAYETAIEGFRRSISSEPTAAAYRGLVESLAEVGRYEEAETAARRGIEAGFRESLLQPLGLVLYAVGERGEAEQLFTEAAEGTGPDRHTARYWRGVALFERGQTDEAFAIFDSFIDLYNDGPVLDSEELEAVGLAVWRMGRRDPVLFQDALKALDRAILADGGNLSAGVNLAALFLEKYDAPEARTSLNEVLRRNPRHPDALLVEAQLRRFEQVPGSDEAIDEALETNPNHVPALAYRAILYLESEALEEAAVQARRALEVNPASLEALSVLAAEAYLAGDQTEFQEIRREVQTLNPGYAGLARTTAEAAVRIRRYADAVELAEEAVALDPRDWAALGLLGINKLRVGLVDEGRADLERAFEGDPYNLWFKNTLDLLDTFEFYDEIETEHFVLVIRNDESELLRRYAEEVAERAWDALVERYGIEPPTPVRIELFPSSADFSVRTVGLTGMGALGVSFGNVMAMDSPSARERGQFNWASVLWHELAHTFHLAASDHRVPRWFTEGLAVHDQRQANPAWGHDPSPAFLVAWRDGELPPPSNLNSGFVRPLYPQHLVHAYYEASLVFQLIEEEWGMQAIRDILSGFADAGTPEAQLESVLGIPLDELDTRFERFMGERFGSVMPAMTATETPNLGRLPGVADFERMVAANPDHYPARVALGRALVAEGRLEEARPHLERALEIFPDDGDPQGPAWLLAQVLRRSGEQERAAEVLDGLVAVNESHVDGNLALGEIRLALGDTVAATRALERATWIYPYDMEVQRQLAELAEATEDWPTAVNARAAVVALRPVDRAEALFQLARAHHLAGEATDARRRVLEALEIAPNFAEALDLLLEIRRGGGG